MKKITLLLAATMTAGVAFSQQMTPLFEVFTSSTCGPCKGGNEKLATVLAGKPTDEYVLVKYQQNFPGTGDPYATAETVGRRTTPYAINSIPRMEVNGGWDGNASNFTSTMYTSARAVAPLYDLTGTYYVDQTAKKVEIRVNYKSLGTVTNPKLYVAIIENETTANKKSNGETMFDHVVKKMLPNHLGTALTASTSWASKSFTFQFNGNYRLPANGQTANQINHDIEHSVEGFNDLRVVAWIQGSDKKVYQAFNLTVDATTNIEENTSTAAVNTIAVSPNPASDFVTITTESKDALIEIYNIAGVKVYSGLPQSETTKVDVSEFTPGIYFLKVNDNGVMKSAKLIKE